MLVEPLGKMGAASSAGIPREELGRFVRLELRDEVREVLRVDVVEQLAQGVRISL